MGKRSTHLLAPLLSLLMVLPFGCASGPERNLLGPVPDATRQALGTVGLVTRQAPPSVIVSLPEQRLREIGAEVAEGASAGAEIGFRISFGTLEAMSVFDCAGCDGEAFAALLLFILALAALGVVIGIVGAAVGAVAGLFGGLFKKGQPAARAQVENSLDGKRLQRNFADHMLAAGSARARHGGLVPLSGLNDPTPADTVLTVGISQVELIGDGDLQKPRRLRVVASFTLTDRASGRELHRGIRVARGRKMPLRDWLSDGAWMLSGELNKASQALAEEIAHEALPGKVLEKPLPKAA
ncbi:MAG: hypothetical protein OEY97_09390 [Nitrospirota bacterium]|nr:hypothetical protein [Nitrospirota bacterium]